MRFLTSSTPIKLVAALGAAVCLALPSLAGAQAYPSYATAPQQTVKGTITGFNGAYTVFVQDDRGYGDNVQMHDGTVINPTGIKLQEGMRVTIYGYANGPVFQAYTINTPYPPAYYGGGYGGYPGYYGGAYPYWGVGVGWWGGGWWGGGWPYYGYYRGPYGFYRGPYGFYRGRGFFRGPGFFRDRDDRFFRGGGTLRGGTLRGGGGRAPVSRGTVHGRP